MRDSPATLGAGGRLAMIQRDGVAPALVIFHDFDVGMFNGLVELLALLFVHFPQHFLELRHFPPSPNRVTDAPGDDAPKRQDADEQKGPELPAARKEQHEDEDERDGADDRDEDATSGGKRSLRPIGSGFHLAYANSARKMLEHSAKTWNWRGRELTASCMLSCWL